MEAVPRFIRKFLHEQQVQAAMTKAINDFIDLSVDIMQQDNGGSVKQKKATTTPTGMSNKEWPSKILESMTPEDKQLGSQVAQSGDLDALRQLMNNQAAHHFRGQHVVEISIVLFVYFVSLPCHRF